MLLTGILVTFYIAKTGYSYYTLPLEQRFYHPRYDWFKPSGLFGQGIGILGTFMILFGVIIYILRKRYGFLKRFIRLKYLLEFHIFLCSLGPILVMFHTTFKFGGIVSIAFWSMVAVVLSGVIGRYIYIQIPRTIEGRALTLHEVKSRQEELFESIRNASRGNDAFLELIIPDPHEKVFFGFNWIKEIQRNQKIRSLLINSGMEIKEVNHLRRLIKEEAKMKSKIGRLAQMQKLFQYWHVAHLPFALILLLIVVIHVAVTLALGYKWIF
ncbi:MAG: hypothetical protein HKN68_22800 [Saprospiraceae bacterium]|nr:hypothetical protein [Saprospiraceae bacterium]